MSEEKPTIEKLTRSLGEARAVIEDQKALLRVVGNGREQDMRALAAARNELEAVKRERDWLRREALALVAVAAGEAASVAPPALQFVPSLLALPAAALFGAVAQIAQLGATLPGVDLVVPRAASLTIGCALGIIGIGLLLRPTTNVQDVAPHPEQKPIGTRIQAIIGACIVAGSCLTAANGAAPNGILRIAVLDVGQGDAILVEYHGLRMLIDGGPDPARLSTELDQIIPPWDRRIDLLIASHPHEDHLAGLPRLIDRYRVASVVGAEVRGGGPASASWNELLQSRRAQYHSVSTGSAFMFGGARLEVLWPDIQALSRAPENGGRALNDRSIVLRLDIPGFSALFTGDIEADLDRTIAARLSTPVDLLKSPHHGSATSASRALLQAADPRISIVSVGRGNSYGHPAPSTLERLAERNGLVARTDRDGTVIALIDPSSPDAISIRTAHTTYLAPRRETIGRVVPSGARSGEVSDAVIPPVAFVRVLRAGTRQVYALALDKRQLAVRNRIADLASNRDHSAPPSRLLAEIEAALHARAAMALAELAREGEAGVDVRLREFHRLQLQVGDAVLVGIGGGVHELDVAMGHFADLLEGGLRLVDVHLVAFECFDSSLIKFFD